MDDRLNQILTRVSAETLEKLAFVFAFADEAPLSTDNDNVFIPAGPDNYQVRVAFEGPFSGSLVMDITPADLKEIAANMLGLNLGDPISDADQQDALKEVANVVCGNLLPVMAGKEAVFDIESPVVSRNGASDPNAANSAPSASARLNLESGNCCLYLFVDGKTPAEILQMTGAAD